MKLELFIPDDWLNSVEEKPDLSRQKALIYLLGTLYQSGQISGGIGAKLMECSKIEFYQLLSENGFAVIDYPAEELADEATINEVWFTQVKKYESRNQ